MHGIIITAYKDFPSILNLVKALDRRYYRILIHIDKKSNIDDVQIDTLRKYGCYVSRKHAIHWGSYNHLLCIIEMINLLIEDKDVDYVHIISGQDYPIKAFDQMRDVCNGKIYMTVTSHEDMPDHVKSRYTRYNIFYPIRRIRILYSILNTASLFIQDILGIDRKAIKPYNRIFKGMVWVSMPLKVCHSILSAPRTRRFLKNLKSTYIPEEFFFQTTIMNSAFAGSVVKHNLRYTDWSSRNGSHPAILDMSDYRKISRSNALFARKIDSRLSRDLILKLKSQGIATNG